MTFSYNIFILNKKNTWDFIFRSVQIFNKNKIGYIIQNSQ